VSTCYAASRHSVLYPKRHRLFARDVAGSVTHDLGVAEENPAAPGTFTLADVPLPDGVYEVEARSTDALWLDARSRNVSTFRLRSGEEPAPELPAVVNLQAGLTTDWWRVLSWSMGGEADDEAFAFGVWLGDESPVDISGPPTITLPRVRGLDHYQHYFRQASPGRRRLRRQPSRPARRSVPRMGNRPTRPTGAAMGRKPTESPAGRISRRPP